VKFTVPLLMAVGARLPESREWLRVAVAEYIEEEIGHQEWILNDIAACGGDKEAVRRSQPAMQTELMIAYAWDMVMRRDPIGFFGMVHVLEGTSVNLADHAADQIKAALNLPERAFSYLRSHGSIDQSHIQHLESLMNRITDPDDQALLLHSTKMFYRLYKGVFDSVLEIPSGAAVRSAACGYPHACRGQDSTFDGRHGRHWPRACPGAGPSGRAPDSGGAGCCSA
jgi:pyrroloquinoline quinone (PQQ) biosynthesis protein C